MQQTTGALGATPSKQHGAEQQAADQPAPELQEFVGNGSAAALESVNSMHATEAVNFQQGKCLCREDCCAAKLELLPFELLLASL
jgi:hypothetical protein